MQARIITFDKAVMSVGGAQHQIASANFTIALNSIPVFAITIPPSSAGAGGASVTHKKATLANDGIEAASILSSFQKAIDDEEPVNIDIEISDDGGSSGGVKYPQELHLQNWILVSAGLGDISSTGAFSVACTVMHPAGRMSTHGGFYGDINSTPELDTIAGAANPVQILLSALASYASAERDDCLEMTLSGIPLATNQKSIMKTIMNDAVAQATKYLKWDSLGHGHLPFVSKMTGEINADHIKKGCGYTIFGADTTSVWNILIGTFCPQLGLAAIPNYKEDPIQISPFFPWIPPSFTVSSDMIYKARFPFVMPSKILGVRTSSSCKRAGEVSTRSVGSQRLNPFDEIRKTGSDYLCIPKKAASKKFGQILSVDVPPLVNSIISVAAGGYTGLVGAPPGKEKIEKHGSGNVDNAISDLNMMSTTWAGQTFLAKYKASDEMIISCPIMFELGGKPLTPGDVVSVTSESGGVIAEGMIREVSHDMSAANGMATTSILLSYVRDEGGKSCIVIDGTMNPIYI